MNDELIDPKKLIEAFSVEELNRFSDDYYKRLDHPRIQLGKPFSMASQTAQLLVRLGLMLENLRVEPGMKILDFGAGTCWLSKWIWQMGCSVVATDVSSEALRLGRTLFTDYPVPNPSPCSWETRLFDGVHLPLKDEEVDRVICFDTFHHVPNQENVASEFYRVLRNGGTIVFNEPLGAHSTTQKSQSEMRIYNVLENDLDMPALKDLFCGVGFEEPTFKVVANPDYMISYEDWLLSKSGDTPEALKIAVTQFQQNSGLFYFQKGRILRDSRQTEGLAHTLSCPNDPLELKVCEPRKFPVSFTNTGSNRWLDKNEAHIGVVHLASRLLDYDSRELLADNSRFRIPKEMEPGDHFAGEIPIAVKRKGHYWLKLDLVSEEVCWFESLGSQPVLIEVKVV